MGVLQRGRLCDTIGGDLQAAPRVLPCRGDGGQDLLQTRESENPEGARDKACRQAFGSPVGDEQG